MLPIIAASAQKSKKNLIIFCKNYVRIMSATCSKCKKAGNSIKNYRK
ncbi:hypothetical protein [Oscillospiraceae bacterium]|nr:hypothetical protein [Oscillospiraceae bacterium]